MSVFFISDLHLCAEHPETTALLRSYLQHGPRPGDSLYILGDLFEAWLGDDVVLPDQRPVLDLLRARADAGVSLYFMHGNRDFLAGAGFANLSGCRLLPDPTVLEIDSERVLLMHGDTLCTDDHDYQAYRARVRDPAFRAHVLALSLEQRVELAAHYRSESARLSRAKPMEIMDVNQQAVEDCMRRHDVRCLIHGHTHRQAVHDFTLDGAPARRIVLGDWHRSGSVLTRHDGEFQLRNFDLTAMSGSAG